MPKLPSRIPSAPRSRDRDEVDRHRDRREDVDDGDREVGAGALVEPQQRQRVLPQGQRPEAEDREPRQPGVGLGRAAAPRSARRSASATSAAPSRSRTATRSLSGRPRRVLARHVEEAEDRLDDAEADDDRAGDDRGEHHLGGAVVRRRQVLRVDRQQEDRDQLRGDARGRVRGAGGRESAQVLEHQGSRHARRRSRACAALPAPTARRPPSASSAQVAGSVVKPV